MSFLTRHFCGSKIFYGLFIIVLPTFDCPGMDLSLCQQNQRTSSICEDWHSALFKKTSLPYSSSQAGTDNRRGCGSVSANCMLIRYKTPKHSEQQMLDTCGWKQVFRRRCKNQWETGTVLVGKEQEASCRAAALSLLAQKKSEMESRWRSQHVGGASHQWSMMFYIKSNFFPAT